MRVSRFKTGNNMFLFPKHQSIVLVVKNRSFGLNRLCIYIYICADHFRPCDPFQFCNIGDRGYTTSPKGKKMVNQRVPSRGVVGLEFGS